MNESNTVWQRPFPSSFAYNVHGAGAGCFAGTLQSSRTLICHRSPWGSLNTPRAGQGSPKERWVHFRTDRDGGEDAWI